MIDPERDSSTPRRNPLEFLAEGNKPIIPSPDSEPVTDEQLAKTQDAMDFFWANAGRMHHFGQRAESRGLTGRDAVVTLIDVDDPVGSDLADVLMPGHDWQSYRDAGETPVARGLADRRGVQAFLEDVGYNGAAAELGEATDLRVLVIRAEVAMVVDVPKPA